jgi:Spy/CpxP family protein refolding chaperone
MIHRRFAIWFRCFVLVSCALLATAHAFADPKHGHDPDKRAKIEARLKEVRGIALRKEVGLEEKKAAEVEAVLAKIHGEREQIIRKMQAQRRVLRELLNKDSQDQNAYSRALVALHAAEDQLNALNKRQNQELAKLLTPKQQAKLGAVFQRMQRRLRKALHKYSAGDDQDD